MIYVQQPGKWVQLPTKPKQVDPDRIIEAVTGFYGVSLVRVKGKDRYRNIVRARHMIYYLLRTLTNESLVGIAERMGRKEHTGIMHGIENIKTFAALYPDVKYEVDTLKFKLTA